MARRRDKRIGRAAARHHMDKAIVFAKGMDKCPIRYADLYDASLDGEYGEAVIFEQVVDILKDDLPVKYKPNQMYLEDVVNDRRLKLGRIIRDDDVMLTVEVTKVKTIPAL